MKSSTLPIAIQERDFEILRGLFDSRVLTLSHIARLYFEGRDEAAKKRVQKLKSAGFIAERPRGVTEPAVHYLTRTAFELLTQQGHLVDFPTLSYSQMENRVNVSPLKLRHELDVQDVKAAFITAINAREGFHVSEFHTWPILYEFKVAFGGREPLVQPDAFIRVVESQPDGIQFERMYFLEVDRSTEAQNLVGHKAACYREYYRSGKFAEWRGGKREAYQEFPFRVLWTFRNEDRRDNAARTMLALTPPLRTLSYLATQNQLLADALGAIWTRPLDYLTTANSSSVDRFSVL